jgi:beta-glucosidase
VTVDLDDRAFSYYDPTFQDWVTEAGEFEIMIGRSSADIVLLDIVSISEGTVPPPPLHRFSTVGDWVAHPDGQAIIEDLLGDLLVDTGESLGADPMTFFRDLPLSVLLTFRARELDAAPREIVAGLLAKLPQD